MTSPTMSTMVMVMNMFINIPMDHMIIMRYGVWGIVSEVFGHPKFISDGPMSLGYSHYLNAYVRTGTYLNCNLTNVTD